MKKKISIIVSIFVFAIISFCAINAFAYELPENAQLTVKGDESCDHSFYLSYSIDASCDYDGQKRYYCAYCSAECIECIPATGHKLTAVTVKAKARTGSAEGVLGYKYNECSVCHGWYDYKQITYPTVYTISKSSYTYDGKAKKPTITVKDSDGNVIPSSNYTVTYSNNTKVGKASAKVVFKNNYSGTIYKYFKIKPTKPTLSSLKYASTGKLVAKWKKNTTGTGYILQYSTSKSFARKNTCTVAYGSNTTVTSNITSLPAKKYYVRVATYKTVDGYKYRSEWSDVKYATVKKGASFKTMVNSTKTDLSGRTAIKEITHGAVDIKKYSTTYDRMKAIYDWHSKNNTKYFASCMECNMSFNDCLYYLYGANKKYDEFIWLAAGDFKNSNGSLAMHKWPVVYIKGVAYIIDPRMQGYTSNKTGTTYFGVPAGSTTAKKYLFDGYWFYWSQDAYKTIV